MISDSWSAECGELGDYVSDRDHNCAILEGVSLGWSSVVLPPRLVPGLCLRHWSCRVGNWPQARERVQVHHLLSPSQHWDHALRFCNSAGRFPCQIGGRWLYYSKILSLSLFFGLRDCIIWSRMSLGIRANLDFVIDVGVSGLICRFFRLGLALCRCLHCFWGPRRTINFESIGISTITE